MESSLGVLKENAVAPDHVLEKLRCIRLRFAQFGPSDATEETHDGESSSSSWNMDVNDIIQSIYTYKHHLLVLRISAQACSNLLLYESTHEKRQSIIDDVFHLLTLVSHSTCALEYVYTLCIVFNYLLCRMLMSNTDEKVWLALLSLFQNAIQLSPSISMYHYI